MYHAKVMVASKVRKNDLLVKSGETVSIIRTTSCPKGKWLARDNNNKCMLEKHTFRWKDMDVCYGIQQLYSSVISLLPRFSLSRSLSLVLSCHTWTFQMATYQ